MNVIIIDGWWGSGKSTIKGLLDGHPNLLVSPIQDSIIGAFCSDHNILKIIDHKDIEAYRSFLATKAHYYRIEKYAAMKYVHFEPKANVIHKEPFSFDFNIFDKKIASYFLKVENPTPKKLIENHFELFFSEWKEYEKKSETLFFVTMEANQNEIVKKLDKLRVSFKYIYVDRKTEGTIATRYSRKPVKGFLGTDSYNNQRVCDFINNGEVLRIIRQRQEIRELQRNQPEKFLVLSLEDTIHDTENTAKTICSFLDIPFHPTTTKFTYCGKTFPGSDLYLADLNDKFEEIFTREDLLLLQQEIKRCENNGGPPNKHNRFRRILGHTRAIASILVGKS